MGGYISHNNISIVEIVVFVPDDLAGRWDTTIYISTHGQQ